MSEIIQAVLALASNATGLSLLEALTVILHTLALRTFARSLLRRRWKVAPHMPQGISIETIDARASF